MLPQQNRERLFYSQTPRSVICVLFLQRLYLRLFTCNIIQSGRVKYQIFYISG